MLETLCAPPHIEKTRYVVEWKGHTWEIDVFHGGNEGLIVAEIELATADQAFEKPPWLGREVSQDARYFNSNLAHCPYGDWLDEGEPTSESELVHSLKQHAEIKCRRRMG